MSFLSVLFVIILICALIGTENIINVLTFAIPIVIIGCILIKKWSDKENEKIENKKMELEKKYFATNYYHSQGYSTCPTATGDHFKALNYSQDGGITDYHYCQHANTSICANCTRRKEHKVGNIYFYGVSNRCQKYFTYDD